MDYSSLSILRLADPSSLSNGHIEVANQSYPPSSLVDL
jgi:hypothetical protein